MNANQRFLVTLFLGVFGIHRFVDHKYGTGVLWLATGGLLWAGWVWDLCQAREAVLQRPPPAGM
jgi:TM2 domain-containing membrane protein YozV